MRFFRAKTFRSKAQDWFLFFGKKTEKLNLYILEIEDELDRQIIEKMLIRVLNPSFEKYREEQKAIRAKKGEKLSTTTIDRSSLF